MNREHLLNGRPYFGLLSGQATLEIDSCDPVSDVVTPTRSEHTSKKEKSSSLRRLLKK
jgi:hypothetical protein